MQHNRTNTHIHKRTHGHEHKRTHLCFLISAKSKIPKKFGVILVDKISKISSYFGRYL